MGLIFAGGGGGGGGGGLGGGGGGAGVEGTDHFRSSGTNRKLLRRVIGPGLLIVYISVSHSTS